MLLCDRRYVQEAFSHWPLKLCLRELLHLGWGLFHGQIKHAGILC